MSNSKAIAKAVVGNDGGQLEMSNEGGEQPEQSLLEQEFIKNVNEAASGKVLSEYLFSLTMGQKWYQQGCTFNRLIAFLKEHYLVDKACPDSWSRIRQNRIYSIFADKVKVSLEAIYDHNTLEQLKHVLKREFARGKVIDLTKVSTNKVNKLVLLAHALLDPSLSSLFLSAVHTADNQAALLPLPAMPATASAATATATAATSASGLNILAGKLLCDAINKQRFLYESALDNLASLQLTPVRLQAIQHFNPKLSSYRDGRDVIAEWIYFKKMYTALLTHLHKTQTAQQAAAAQQAQLAANTAGQQQQGQQIQQQRDDIAWEYCQKLNGPINTANTTIASASSSAQPSAAAIVVGQLQSQPYQKGNALFYIYLLYTQLLKQQYELIAAKTMAQLDIGRVEMMLKIDSDAAAAAAAAQQGGCNGSGMKRKQKEMLMLAEQQQQLAAAANKKQATTANTNGGSSSSSSNQQQQQQMLFAHPTAALAATGAAVGQPMQPPPSQQQDAELLALQKKAWQTSIEKDQANISLLTSQRQQSEQEMKCKQMESEVSIISKLLADGNVRAIFTEQEMAAFKMKLKAAAGMK